MLKKGTHKIGTHVFSEYLFVTFAFVYFLMAYQHFMGYLMPEFDSFIDFQLLY